MKYLTILFCIALILIAGCTAPQNGVTSVSPVVSSSPIMKVSYIDVGQGDSELIQFPNGEDMLIDSGPPESNSKEIQFLRGMNIKTIDVVVATHPHDDHIGNMVSVMKDFDVKEFIDSGTNDPTSSHYKNMMSTIKEKNISFVVAKTGDTITLDPNVSITVLNPSVLVTNDYNQNSVVLKMVYHNVSYLFTGDAGEPVEESYAKSAGHIDILKVAHHGSGTSSYDNFLSVITPKVSIIEVGKGNTYGHPVASTIARLQKIGSQVYRTDQDGSLVVTSNGETYSLNTVVFVN